MGQRPQLTPEQKAAGYVIVHRKSVYTELTAALPLRPPLDEFQRGFKEGARQWKDRAIDLIDNGSFMEPGWPFDEEDSDV